jgi:hypothetical protein
MMVTYDNDDAIACVVKGVCRLLQRIRHFLKHLLSRRIVQTSWLVDTSSHVNSTRWPPVERVLHGTRKCMCAAIAVLLLQYERIRYG